MLRSVAKAGAAALPRRAVGIGRCSNGIFLPGCSVADAVPQAGPTRTFSQSVQDATVNVTFVDISVSSHCIACSLLLLRLFGDALNELGTCMACRILNHLYSSSIKTRAKLLSFCRRDVLRYYTLVATGLIILVTVSAVWRSSSQGIRSLPTRA